MSDFIPNAKPGVYYSCYRNLFLIDPVFKSVAVLIAFGQLWVGETIKTIVGCFEVSVVSSPKPVSTQGCRTQSILP